MYDRDSRNWWPKISQIETFLTVPSNLRENISIGNSSILKDKKVRTTIKVFVTNVIARTM